MTFLERILEDPVRLARLKRWSLILLALILVAEVVLPLVFPGKPHHLAIEDWPAWGSVYGLISCVVIIIVSKFIGKVWLMREEDHYDD